MAEGVQSYKNHARLLPAFHFFVIPVLMVNLLNNLRYLWRTPNWGTALGALVGVALVMLALLARTQALTVQDRLIRLEMRLRLRQILPADLQAHITSLTPKQMVALRFACDEEMPDLVREVVAGRLASQKDIKLRVKNWQGDFLRA